MSKPLEDYALIGDCQSAALPAGWSHPEGRASFMASGATSFPTGRCGVQPTPMPIAATALEVSMDLVGRAKRVRIYVNEDDKVRHAPASFAIVELLRRENAQGATVLRGAAGFGSTGRIHTFRLVDVVQHLPEIVEWVDAPDVVERLLPRVKELVPRGLITIDVVARR